MKRNVMIVMAGLALLASCAQNTKPKAQNEAKGTEEQVPVFAVGTTRAVKGQIRDYLALSGDIVSGTTVDAYSDVAGKVTKLYVSVGQRVEKDEPLAEVDPSRPG